MARPVFDTLAPKFMQMLIDAFGVSPVGAAAVIGNFGHESSGFAKLQEIRPTVKGSRGGWGLAQWTGKRRQFFEAWAHREGVPLNDLTAQMRYVILELREAETLARKAWLTADEAKMPLDQLTMLFEKRYERAGVKHYPSRIKWAERALRTYTGKTGASQPKASAFDPSNRLIVRGVQFALQRLGYPSVGIVDGLHGSRTSGAIAAFEHDRGLAKTGKISVDLVAALADAEATRWKRPNAPERQSTTASDLRAGGSRIAQESHFEKIKGGAAAGGALIVGTVKAAGDQVEALQPVMSMLDAVPGWLWALIVIVMAVSSYIAAQRIERARVEDHRSGKTPGIGPVEYDYAVDPTSRVQYEQEIAE